jgi:hypothetical protein
MPYSGACKGLTLLVQCVVSLFKQQQLSGVVGPLVLAHAAHVAAVMLEHKAGVVHAVTAS